MMQEAMLLADAVRVGLGAAIAAVGLVFILGGAIGMLRFPDFYTRLQAAGAVNAVGAVIVLIGLAIVAWDIGLSVKLALLAVLIAAVSPTVSQLVANAAHSAGLSPIAGAYVAPRPGKQRKEPRP